MRSSAKVKLHPYADNPDLAVDVLWYKVPEDRPVLDVETIFGWDQWNQIHDVPEQRPGFERAYKWDRGIDVWQFDGACYAGTPDQWLNGCLTTDPAVEVDPLTGQPLSCGFHVLLVAGGAGDGGNALWDAVRIQTGGDLQGGSPKLNLAASEKGGELQGGTGLYSAARTYVGGEEHGGTAHGLGLVAGLGGELHGGTTVEGGQLQPAVGGELHGGDAWGVSKATGGAGGEEQGGKWISAVAAVYVGGEEQGGAAAAAGVTVRAGGEEHGGTATVSWGGTAGPGSMGGEEQGGSANVALGPTTILNSGGSEEGGTATVTRSDIVIQAQQYTGSTINAQVLLFEINNPNGVHANFHIQNTHASYSINFWWTHTDMDGGSSTYNTNIGPNGFLQIDFHAGLIQGTQKDGWIPFKDVKVYVGDYTAGSHATYNAWVSTIT